MKRDLGLALLECSRKDRVIQAMEGEIQMFNDAMARERKADWEAYVKGHADFLANVCQDVIFTSQARELFKAASILLNEHWQSFTHKANFVPARLEIEEARRLLTACLNTGSLRTDTTRELYLAIREWLKLPEETA